MNKIYYTQFLIVLSLISYGKDLKIKWSDRDGREFSITCIYGEFNYSKKSSEEIQY